MTRTVSQKMGIKENSRTFFFNADKEALGKVYNNSYGKLNES